MIKVGKCIFCLRETRGAELEVGGSIMYLNAPEICIAPDCQRKGEELYQREKLNALMPKLLAEVPEVIRETSSINSPSDKARSIAQSWIPNSKGKHLFICGE